ncbi:SDR family NAD(P)-dependent oxidoreductase [Trichococcus alkaliphilus]|uniref:SDR family NAD(P)-dependent oxidoreductase n=1 Tax=Trichococcus alkaliphilus TaxID=2052943 RepID=UPI001374ACEE|nr:SDR family NAD(P)-dependent oxidoreductase [Trichococcus alkaliphilus]
MLADRIVLITGGTRGIGFALAKAFLSAGDHVVITSKTMVSIEQAEADLIQYKDQLWAKCCDVRNRKNCQQLVQDIVEKFDRLDILINNAGICADGQFYKMSEDNWDQVTDTNINSLYNATQPVVQQMMKQPEPGFIYSMTSTAGMYGVFGQTNYSASKAAVIGFTYALAEEVKRFNIQVNAISPAAKTDMTIPAIKRVEEACARKGESFPDYWRIGSSEQVASRIIQLIDSPKTPTGTVFGINGDQVWTYHRPERSEYVI